MEIVPFGHMVRFQRALLSNDNQPPEGYASVMEAEFNKALCARVRALRVARGWTAEQMATALGIPPERYRKYESRTPLPHYLVERFALIVGREVEFVLTGKATDQRRRAG